MRKAVLFFAVIATLVALIVSGIPGQVVPTSTTQTTPSGGNGIVAFIGSATGLPGATFAALRAHVNIPVTAISELAALPGVARQAGASSLFIFNSTWLLGKIGDAGLMAFLKTVLPAQAKVVAIGGSTSLLFDALQQARGGIFADGRNPAADNPLLAGYRIRQAIAPDGTVYFGDSILIGSPTDATSAADSILSWG